MNEADDTRESLLAQVHALKARLAEVEEEARANRRNLERRVLERTRELERANQSLQAEIAERERSAQVLRQSEERAQAISDLTSDYAYSFLVLSDGSLMAEWVTDAFTRVTGYTLEDLKNHGWQAFMLADDLPSLEQSLRRVLQGEVMVIEHRVATKQGEPRWVRDYSRPVFDASQQRVVRIYGAAQDITEQRGLEEQVREAQKMETAGRLAGGVCHEFNNLLTGIMGYSELLLMTLAPDDPARDNLLQIKKAVDRAASLTRQLLAFARRQFLPLQPVDLNAILGGIETMLRRMVGEHIEVILALAPNLGHINGNAGQLEQTIVNLVDNAREAMPRGGRLTLSTRTVELDATHAKLHRGVKSGPYVLLEVADTGCGMSEETRTHLFEPFFTTKKARRGTGLGLSTLYGIVKQSGGYLEVQSELGRGSTFRILLPRLCDPVSGLAASLDATTPRKSAGRTILVVEDEPMVREWTRRVLERLGYFVLHTPNGADAQELAQNMTYPIDLLLTDMVLPGITGQELFAHLRLSRPNLKVLYVSGHSMTLLDQYGPMPCAANFLQKPFTPEVLERKVLEILR